MDQFKQYVKRYVDIETNIKEIQSQVKTLRNEKEQLTEIIVAYMSSNDIQNCNVGNSVLTLKTSTQLESMNKDYIHDKIEEFFRMNSVPNDASQAAQNATEYLVNNRESTEKQTLKLLKKK